MESDVNTHRGAAPAVGPKVAEPEGVLTATSAPFPECTGEEAEAPSGEVTSTRSNSLFMLEPRLEPGFAVFWSPTSPMSVIFKCPVEQMEQQGASWLRKGGAQVAVWIFSEGGSVDIYLQMSGHAARASLRPPNHTLQLLKQRRSAGRPAPPSLHHHPHFCPWKLQCRSLKKDELWLLLWSFNSLPSSLRQREWRLMRESADSCTRLPSSNVGIGSRLRNFIT